MGIKVDEPTFIFGDNKSTSPGSTLKKKSNAIAYHFVREGVACDEWRTAYVGSDDNVAEMLTKPLSGPKQSKVCSNDFAAHIPCQRGVGLLGED